MRRSQIKPEPQQRFLSFEFVALPRRFRAGNKEPEPVPIRGAIWETDGDATSIQLGVQFAMEGLSLLNAHHPARIAGPWLRAYPGSKCCHPARPRARRTHPLAFVSVC